ncbi:caspase family protein [Streptomyces amritsarensis]|uniref:caspase family protein n=1 Tax=Streptomyces amritsarensis TaxID=681158 RepID=UPI0036B8D3AC
MADPERHALLVVTSTYEDPSLSALRAPADDAEALAKVLADPDIGGFEVDVLADPDSRHLRIKVEDLFADRSPRDTLLLHFSCHGVKNTAGKLFLATTDTRSSRLASTAVPAEYVSSLMLESRAQRAVVLLDCCYAGAFASGLLIRSGTDAHVKDSFQNLDHMGTKRGRAVFTASSSIQVALEPDSPVPSTEAVRELSPSLFTEALVEGLRTGAADRDGDGKIGMSELADYVTDRIADETPHQTPQLWLFGTHGGDMAIAHSRKTLPPWLDRKVHSANRVERLEAVADCGTLLHGDDVGFALSARTALSELERDDSRRVSEGAKQVILAARPKIASDSVDLGAMTIGAPGPQTLLTVESPPVARASMKVHATPWLETRRVAGGVLLSAAPSEPGHYEGDVLIFTATGELPVHVSVKAVAEKKKKRSKDNAKTQKYRWLLPFILATGLLIFTNFAPILTSDGVPFGVYQALSMGQAWLIPATVLAGLAANVTVVSVALRQSAYPPDVLLPVWYTAVAAVTLAVVGDLISTAAVYPLGAGSVALGVASLCETWGSVALWRRQRRIAQVSAQRQ